MKKPKLSASEDRTLIVEAAREILFPDMERHETAESSLIEQYNILKEEANPYELPEGVFPKEEYSTYPGNNVLGLIEDKLSKLRRHALEEKSQQLPYQPTEDLLAELEERKAVAICCWTIDDFQGMLPQITSDQAAQLVAIFDKQMKQQIQDSGSVFFKSVIREIFKG